VLCESADTVLGTDVRQDVTILLKHESSKPDYPHATLYHLVNLFSIELKRDTNNNNNNNNNNKTKQLLRHVHQLLLLFASSSSGECFQM
jgi:hypothetical protein